MMQTPEGYMKNHEGHLVPIDAVDEIDKLRDTLVNELVDMAKIEQEGMKTFKANAKDEIEDFLKVAFNEHKESFGGKKGNMTLMSYDGCKKVNIAIAEHLAFDEKLEIAKQLIDEQLVEWSEDANPNLRSLVMTAFKVDDKTGKVSVQRLLSLRRQKLEGEKWNKAMKMITESIVVQGSKEYIRFYERKTPEDAWQGIPLDLAKL
jgi:ElaB/YqjD/DUF883 family membrane-anchored ribosome-binding protein